MTDTNLTTATSVSTKQKALIAGMIFCAFAVIDCLHFVSSPDVAKTGLTMAFIGLVGILTSWCLGSALTTTLLGKTN